LSSLGVIQQGMKFEDFQINKKSSLTASVKSHNAVVGRIDCAQGLAAAVPDEQ